MWEGATSCLYIIADLTALRVILKIMSVKTRLRVFRRQRRLIYRVHYWSGRDDILLYNILLGYDLRHNVI